MYDTYLLTYLQVGWCLMALSAKIGYVVPWLYEIYCVWLGTNTITQETKPKKCKKSLLLNLIFVEIISSTWIGVLRSLSSQSLGKY